MRLRDAQKHDIGLLREWSGRPHVVDATGGGDWGWETEIGRDVDWRDQLIAEVDGRPVGYVEIIDPAREETHYWGACEPNYRAIDLWLGSEGDAARGYGRELMRLALDRCFSDPDVVAVLVDPRLDNLSACAFFQRLGFTLVGHYRFDDDEVSAVHQLHRPVWERLQSQSPPPRPRPRVRLRGWREADLEPFAKMNADPRVAEFLPSTLTRQESDAFVGRIEMAFATRQFGLWAVERIDVEQRPFIGFVGLSVPTFDAEFTPCVEIGWRLAPEHWGLGLATEAAQMVVHHAFEVLGLPQVVSFTVPENRASRRVMEKLGMTHDPGDDFDHPNLRPGHPLRRHVLYRLLPSAPR